MAHAKKSRKSQAQVPELSALQAQQMEILTQSTETRGILDALCQVLMDSGLVQKEKLLAEAHRQSFAAVRQAHRCDWNLFLECVFRSRDVAFKIASCFVNKKDCLGLRTASRAFATCMAEVSSALVEPKVFVWGGDDVATEAADMFDPVFKTWDTFPSTHEFPKAVSAVINGRFYVCGGQSISSGSSSKSLDCFDPHRGSWQSLPPMSQGRCGQSVAVVGARLYVCGGWSDDRALESAECFDTLTTTWQSLPAMVCPHYEAGAAVIRQHVYIVGGYDFETSAERLLPTGNWEELPDMKECRQYFATAVINDRLYVCGGDGSAAVERFDPDVGVWEQLQPMTEARGFAAAAVLRGQLYMCGGLGDEDDNPLSSVERFDPKHNRWERLAAMTHERSFPRGVEIDGRLFICGGLDQMPLSSAEWFDPGTGRWEVLPDMSQVRVRPHLAVVY